MLNISGRRGLSRRALMAVGAAVAGGSLAVAVATIGSASTSPTETLTLTNHTPISASDTGFNTGCSDLPSDVTSQIPSTDDIWHFVVTARNTFNSISLSFSPGSVLVGPIYEHGQTQAYFGTTPGAVLRSATAVVNLVGTSTTNVRFTLSDTCAAKGSPPPPSPPPSPSESSSPTTTPPAPAPTPVHTNLPVTG